MHTSRSGLEMWKQRRCTGNMDEGAGQKAGNSSQLWAVLGTSGKDVAADLGDKDTCTAHPAGAGTSTASRGRDESGACSLPWLHGIAMGGGQQGCQGTANNQATLAERNERLGGERKLAGGFTLSSRMENKGSHSLLAAPA